MMQTPPSKHSKSGGSNIPKGADTRTDRRELDDGGTPAEEFVADMPRKSKKENSESQSSDS